MKHILFLLLAAALLFGCTGYGVNDGSANFYIIDDDVNQLYFDDNYLRLDTSNDPLTGNLEISKVDPEFKQTDFTTGNIFTQTLGTNQNFELTSGDFVFSGGNVNVDKNVYSNCYFMQDGNYFCDVEDISSGISLDEYIPYTGATADINLGLNDLTIDGNIYAVNVIATDVVASNIVGSNGVFDNNVLVRDDLRVDGNFYNKMPHLYGIATEMQSPLAIDTWRAIDFNFDIGDAYGFTPSDSNGIIVSMTGHYFVALEVFFEDHSPSADSEIAVRITQNGVEVEGSYSQISAIKQDADIELATITYVEAEAGDVLQMQWITDDLDVNLQGKNTWSSTPVHAKGFINWGHP